ncbi:MAG: hypothetical protein ACJAUH_000004 [Saprospiraceae bacterium]|jgi:hypothetical protein
MLQIEKVVKLLDDYHFDVFREYVKNISIRSYYPLLLLDSINRSIELEQSTEEFCEEIYTEDNPNDEKTKKKFFQLAHYTFKLTQFLSRNYPAYLAPNINKIQHFINNGHLNKANFYLNALLDISEKIEDFGTYITALNIQALQYELQENIKDVVKNYTRQAEIINYRSLVNQIYLYRQQHFSVKSKPKSNADIEAILSFFTVHFESKSLVVSALSQYFYLHGLNFFNAESFFDKATFDKIEKLEKLLENNSYLVFPFLEDLEYRVAYLKLRSLIQNFDDNRVIELSAKILDNSEATFFWKNFASQPEIFSIAVQASYLSSKYNTAFKSNHLETLLDDVKKRLDTLYSRCEDLLEKDEILDTTAKHIAVTNSYACLLLLGNDSDNLKAIQLLEGLLFTYQQIPFHAYIDPIFAVKISAYFNLKDYEGLENCYRRYKKMTDKKSVNPENDFTIHVLYYTAKWLETNRNQYLKKLQKRIDETPERARNTKLLQDIIGYFDLDFFN